MLKKTPPHKWHPTEWYFKLSFPMGFHCCGLNKFCSSNKNFSYKKPNYPITQSPNSQLRLNAISQLTFPTLQIRVHRSDGQIQQLGDLVSFIALQPG